MKLIHHFRAGAKQMYYFSEFTASLNQDEDGVCITDSRKRPDIRLMEQQNFDEANRVKMQLEEKQRGRRRIREQEAQAAKEAGKFMRGIDQHGLNLSTTSIPIMESLFIKEDIGKPR